uniref:Uncharacterized protein n=1 Tax=Ciona savignyi TaxID=51511 RepID=H2Z0N0_CIOSA
MKYYTRAASLGFAQAMFNVATVMDKHRDINVSTVEVYLPLACPVNHQDDAVICLYKMCTELPTRESLLPCHIALAKARLSKFWKITPAYIKTVGVLFTLIMLTILYMITHRNNSSDTEIPA